MISSLSLQLKNIGTVDAKGVSKHSAKYKASFLFDSKQAADYDLDTIYSVGINGLTELRQHDERFSIFEKTLFSESMKNYDRTLKTKEDNAILDEKINTFLQQLSPFFLLKSAGKAIEWLIRRFRINEFNVTSIMRCILPYHETKPFVTFISLLKLEEENNVSKDIALWTFLRPVKKSHHPLEAETLIQRCIKERALLEFICSMVHAYALMPHALSFRSLFSFYSSIVVRIVQTLPTITSDFTTAILPYLLDGLKAKLSTDYQLSTYMILSQLFSRVELSQEAVLSLNTAMAQHFHEQNAEHMLLCMIHLAQSQKKFQELSTITAKAIISIPNIGTLLTNISRKYNVDKFLRSFLQKLITCSESDQDPKSTGILMSILEKEQLPSSIVRYACTLILDTFLKNDTAPEQLQRLLRVLHSRYSSDVDYILDAKLKESKKYPEENGEQIRTRLYQFTAIAFKGTIHEPIDASSTTLFLSLNHSEASFRLIALKKLISLLEHPENGKKIREDHDFVIFVKDTITARILDTSKDVVNYLLSIPQYLLEFVPPEELIAILEKALSLDSIVISTKKKLLGFLMKDFMESLAQGSDEYKRLKRKVYLIILPRLFATDRTKKICIFMLESLVSSVLKEDVLVKDIAVVLKALTSKNQDESAIISANEQLVNVLGENLATLGNEEADLWLEMATIGKAEDQVLSLLVLSRAVTELSGAEQLAMATSILAIVRQPSSIISKAEHFELNTDFDTSRIGIPSKNLMMALVTKSPSDLQSRVELFALRNLVSGIRAPLEHTFWLSYSDDSQETRLYKDLIRGLYCRFVSAAAFAIYEQSIKILFEVHLKDTVVEFLAAFWTDSNSESSVVVQMRSLQIAKAYFLTRAHDQIEQKVDFQLIIPSLLIVLSYPSKILREAAIECLRVIEPIFAKGTTIVEPIKRRKDTISMDVFKHDNFYGKSSGHLLYLSTDTAAKFVHMLLEMAEEFRADKSYLGQFLSNFLEKQQLKDSKHLSTQKDSILSYLLSHILAFDKPVAQIQLLQMLSNIKSAAKIKTLLPLLDTILARETTPTNSLSKTLGFPATEDLSLELLELLINCFTVECVPLLELKNNKCFKTFISMLQIQATAHSDIGKSACKLVLNQVTDKFFSKLTLTKQAEIFTELINLATNGVQDIVKNVKDVFRRIRIQSQLVNQELIMIQELLVQGRDSEQPSKRVRNSSEPEQESFQAIYRLVTILELLDYKPIEDEIALITSLFDTLSTIINHDLTDSPISLEYISQLIQSSLTTIIRNSEEKKIHIEENLLQVELVVRCIRATTNPQTNNQSLLLIAAIASIYPERVLRNIMPVFTFMGAHVLRKDDNYSFQVIQQTLEKIIPPLVASHRQSGESSAVFASHVKPIITVFVDALFHIPKHRRLRLFTVLIQILGEEEFLYAIIILILEKYTEKLQKGHTTEAESLSEFCLTISNQFPPECEIKSLISLLESLLNLPYEKPDENDTMAMDSSSLFNLSEHSDKQLRQFKLESLKFTNRLLSSKGFLTKLFSMSHAHHGYETIMEQYYLKMAEVLLKFIGSLGQYYGQYSTSGDAQPSISKFWRGLLKLAYEVLDQVNGLLSFSSFLNIVTQLLNHNDFNIRRKAMLLFNEKVTNVKGSLTADEEIRVVGMLSKLSKVVENEGTLESEGNSAISKQTALLCISTLTRQFSHNHQTEFADIVPAVIGRGSLLHSHSQVKVSSIACLTSLIQELGPRIVPNLPEFAPSLLEIMQSAINDLDTSSSTILSLSVTNCLVVMVKTLSQFMGPYLSKMLDCTMSLLVIDPIDNQRQQILEKSHELLSAVATKVPPRVLLAPLLGCFENTSKQGRDALVTLFETVGEAIAEMNRDAITTNYKQIFKFFLTSFDLRTTHCKDMPTEDIDVVENHAITAFLELVMKLNETLFRPMFLRTLDWAIVEPTAKGSDVSATDIINRLIFFYRLMNSLLDRLKSIIVPYFDDLLDNCIERLQMYRNDNNEPDALWNLIMNSLHKSFIYDSDGFWNAKKFEMILHPLTGQLLVTSGSYMKRITELFVPTIGQLAVTVSDDNMWKSLNYQILMKTREDDALIKIAALRCLEEIYSRLGEEFLVLLPETIPFLAELLEDDDNRVEKLTQEVIAHIETYLGESLDKYFR